MGIKLKFLGLAGVLSPLVWSLQLAGCTADNSSDAAAGTAGSTAGAAGSTAGTGGSAGSSAGSSGSAGTAGSSTSACANPVVIPSTKPSFANFDNYTVGSNLATWNFALGGDSSSGVLSGTFGYGDRSNGQPETFEMAAGNTSMYAMRIADTDPSRAAGATGLYGGGMGLWISACLNATAFTGVSFSVRGNSPSPTATFTVAMGDTLSSTPSASGTFGTCAGTSTTCINPKFNFPVTDAWVQIKAPWSAFTPGDAAGTSVTPDGRDITQLQWDVGLQFVPETDGGSVYVAVPAAYELAVDDVSFY